MPINRADAIGFLAADWPAPPGIRAGITLRAGGVSAPPFDALNLGAHTQDDAETVAANRARLRAVLDLPAEPAWLNQIHGRRVACADGLITEPADASVGTQAHAVCAVLTADCLPVLLCDQSADCWAAAHAGWRGLAAGVLEATAAALPAAPDRLMAWLGPAIGAACFEVGAEVRAAFCDVHPADAAAFLPAAAAGKHHADIYALARARLTRAGITTIYGGGLCTVTDARRFYSYRRAAQTGRMASLIWRVA